MESPEDELGEPVFTAQDRIVEQSSLSPREIDEMISDLYGIAEEVNNLREDDPPHPTPLLVLENVMSKLPLAYTAAYRQAVIKCPGLVSDERKLVFLKRENGDPALAAVRLALHWESRLEIFGPERCFLPMTLTGAMRGEVENMVRWPIHHLLPVKDTAGRAIWYADPSHRDFEQYSYKQELMQLWYILEVASEDPEVLKHGLVLLSNWENMQIAQYPQNGENLKPKKGYVVRILERALPIHLRALHYCHPNLALYELLPSILHAMGKHYRLRQKTHRGSKEMVLKDLEGYCLPKDRVPAELGGEIVLDMAKFLIGRLSLESARPDPLLALNEQSIVLQGVAALKQEETETTTRHRGKSPTEGLIEGTIVRALTETQSTLAMPSKPMSGPILPEDDGIGRASLPIFTPEDKAAELATLTSPEIRGIWSDLHGITAGVAKLKVDDRTERPPRPAVLSRLEDELSKLSGENNAAYRQALIKCPGMVSDKRKMAFLDREDGNPVLAAARLALYWQLRLKVFGPERCFLPMTLNGAMRGEAENMIKWPVHHLLPVKDTAGRAIWYGDPTKRDLQKCSYEHEIMGLWYLVEVAMEDAEVLKNGLVMLGNTNRVERKHFSDPKSKQLKPLRGNFMFCLENAMPINLRAIHVCHPTMAMYYMTPVALYFYGKSYRNRFLMHRGSEAKILQELEEFCLPKNCLPTPLGGEVVLDMAKFLINRLSLESARPDPRNALDQQSVVVPGGPSAKRIRSESKTTKQVVSNGRSDPRMTKAIEARLANPDLTPQEALEKGGFAFNFLDESNEPMDAENITLQQRKNQLCRRLRKLKNAGLIPQQQEQPVQQSAEARTSTGSSSNNNNNNSASKPAPTTACRATTANPAPSLERRDSFDEAISEVVDGDEPNITVFLERRDSFADATSKDGAEESNGIVPVLERRDSFDDAISAVEDVEVSDIAEMLERQDHAAVAIADSAFARIDSLSSFEDALSEIDEFSSAS